MKRWFKRMVMVLGLVVVVSAPLCVQADEPSRTPPIYLGDKGDHNPDGSKRIPPSPPMSEAQRTVLARKEQLAADYAKVRQGTLDAKVHDAAYQQLLADLGETTTGRAPVAVDDGIDATPQPNTDYWGHWLGLTQVAQNAYNYCGPASAYAILQALGYGRSHDGETLSQATLATRKYLETDYWGNTPWYTGGYPYPETLNYWRTGSYSGFYIATGTAVNADTFKSSFTWDIDHGWPLAGNAWEDAYGDHLVGHPQHLEIFHWVAVYGYGDYGNQTAYADPASGATSVGWTGVPRYSSFDTGRFAGILNGRGYVW